MNKTILMGRLTKDPEVKYLQDENSTAMARYTLAVGTGRTQDPEILELSGYTEKEKAKGTNPSVDPEGSSHRSNL